MARGLSSADALAALTTTPAGWLGIERTNGTIESGTVANLIVSEGDLFTEEATVRDVWVHGRVYGVTRPTQIDPRGTWRIASDYDWGFDAVLCLEGPLNSLSGSMEVVGPGGTSIDLVSAEAVAETGRIAVRFHGEDLGYEGMALLSGSVRGDEFYGWTSLPNGADPAFRGTRTQMYEGEARGTVAMDVPDIDLPFIRPMMEYGRTSIPEQPSAVVARNATVWT